MKIVIDSSCLIHFFKQYYFDKNYSMTVYNKIYNFLLDKIKSGEIVIIEKVANEFKHDPTKRGFKNELHKVAIDTDFLLPEIQAIRDTNINEFHRIEFMSKHTTDELNKELSDYETIHADLHLVSYCKYLKEQGEKNVILITDENYSYDGKIVEKIPTICSKIGIKYDNLQYLLFELYEANLVFGLDIK